MTHADFLDLVLADEVTRREAKSASLRARAAGLDAGMRPGTWEESAAVRYDRSNGTSRARCGSSTGRTGLCCWVRPVMVNTAPFFHRGVSKQSICGVFDLDAEAFALSAVDEYSDLPVPARPGCRPRRPGAQRARHDPHRYPDARARKNYAATSPITRASGKKKIVAAKFIHNDRLIDALMAQAFAAPERFARRPRLLR
jgi:hypothetical protein